MFRSIKNDGHVQLSGKIPSEITALRAFEAGALNYLLMITLLSGQYSLRSVDKNGQSFAISTRFSSVIRCISLNRID
jgi:hypothetical protein